MAGRRGGGRRPALTRGFRIGGRRGAKASAMSRRLRGDERGQASVEVLGAVPALLVLGLVVFQLLAVGYAGVLAGTAAETGALAFAGGADAEEAIRESLPGWSRARARVTVSGGTVRVRLRPPSPLPSIARKLEVTGRASVGGP